MRNFTQFWGCATVFWVAIGIAVFPLLYLLVTGDFPGSQVFYGLQEDNVFVTFLLNIR